MDADKPLPKPSDIFMYTLRPTRLAMLTEGQTDAEKALTARHWAYSQELLAKGIVIFAGRTLVTNEDCFATVVIRAKSEAEARAIMEGDPGVKGELFSARLLPYQPVLMGVWPDEA